MTLPRTQLSQAMAKRIEAILSEHIDLLITQAKEYGRWFIPELVSQQIQEIAGDKLTKDLLTLIVGDNNTNIDSKNIFLNSDLVSEKFCRLKIKEIRFLLSSESYEKPSSNVTLCFLEHKKGKIDVNVNIVTVIFNEFGLADSITHHCPSKTYSNSFVALKSSKWLYPFPNETIIRFADRMIEDKLSVKLYCKEIEYAIAADQVKYNDGNGKNFWEMYAISYRTESINQDISVIKSVKKEIIKYKTGIKQPQINPDILKIANNKEELNQDKHISLILRNQMMGMGSLLYLPTGSGKTFIMVLTMAQHYVSLPANKRKPYLVVAPNNVQVSWADNLDKLKEQYEGPKYIFGEPLEYFKVENTEVFADYIKSIVKPNESTKYDHKKYQIVLITEGVLKNFVENNYHQKNNINLTRISKFKELLKKAGVIKGETLIIGDSIEDWRQQIVNVFQYLCIPTHVTEQLNSLSHDLGINNQSQNRYVSDEIWKQYFSNFENTEKFISVLEKNSKTLNWLIKSCRLEESLSDKSKAYNLFKLLNLYFNSSQILESMRFKSIRDYEPNQAFIECFGENKDSILSNIENISQEQLNAQHNNELFMDSFNGIIADESQYLFVKNPGEAINSRDIIFEISDYYQTKSKIGSQDNRLIIAASATPWPNDLDQLKLHLQFLASQLMKDNASINKYLFEKWDYLVHQVQEYSQNRKDSNRLDIIKKSSDEVLQYLHFWIKIFFDELVIYEKATAETLNEVNEKFLYITCDSNNKIDIAASDKKGKNTKDQQLKNENETNILRIIGRFYSGLLGCEEHDVDKKGMYNEICKQVDELNGNFTDTVQQCLGIINQRPKDKIAIYVEEHKDALFLEKIISDYFLNNSSAPSTEILFYYSDDFVRNQGRDSKTKTNNIRRDSNKNAFNNEFNFSDYNHFMSERFNISSMKQVMKKLEPLYILFKALLENDLKKREQYLKDSDQKYSIYEAKKPKKEKITVFDSLFKHLSKALSDYINKPIKSMDEIKNKITSDITLTNEDKKICLSFIEFMQIVVEFENISKSQIIYFDLKKDSGKNWLLDFSKFIPNVIKDNKDIDNKYQEFREYIDTTVQEQGIVDENIMLSIQYSLIYYIHKMYMSRIFIFGQAGTSGMRIDADAMFMFSGAWTEGKLTQIRGRFGRIKSSANPRPCDIYIPLTNSSFEYFILKYYIIKSLYDTFITAPLKLNGSQLCNPIMLSHLLYYYYRQTSDHFINNDVVRKIQEYEAASPKSYFALPPFDKAKVIISSDIQKALNEFSSTFDLLPTTDGMQDDLDDIQLSQEPEDYIEKLTSNQLEFKAESWHPSFTDEIVSYVKSRSVGADIGGLTQEYVGGILLAFIDNSLKIDTRTLWAGSIKQDGPVILPQKAQEEKLDISKPREKSYETFITLTPETNNGIIHIDQKLFEKQFHINGWYEITGKDEQSIRQSYTMLVKEFEFTHVPDKLHEFYINLNTEPGKRHLHKKIIIDTLKIRNHEFELFGYICGGHESGNSHFWTYRRSQDGYYICDDLHNIQLVNNIELPINNNAILFKFVRKDKINQYLSLVPKKLVNKNNNCYIHAAFQLAETLELHEKIKIHNKTKSLSVKINAPIMTPLSKKSSKTSTPIVTNKSPKPYVEYEKPKIEPHTNSIWTEKDWIKLKKFCIPTKKLFIIMVPSRGISSDLSLNDFAKHLELSCDTTSQIILLFGTNNNNKEELAKIVSQNIKVTQQWENSKKLYIKEIPFIWFERDIKRIKKPILPYGQMRNFCLSRVQELWKKLTSNEFLLNRNLISLVSADGDTELTSACLQRARPYFDSINNTIVVFGYEIYYKNSIVSANINVDESQSAEYLSALTNHISMNVNSVLSYEKNSVSKYIGYPSEPMLYLNPRMVEFLFTNTICQPDKFAPFGFWDIEGRQFITSMYEICSTRGATLHVIAPDKIAENRPILRSSERFQSAIIEFPYLKQKLSKNDFSTLIKKLASQSQSSMNVHFFSSSLAYFLNVKRAKYLLTYPSFFYINNTLRLLNLGPYRTSILAKWLRNRYVEKTHDSNHITEHLQVNDDIFINFINATFQKLFEKNPEIGLKIFDVVTQWLLEISRQFLIWFQQDFDGERDSSGNYLPMETPEDYPTKSVQNVTEENPFDLTIDIKDYFVKVKDYSEYSRNSNKLSPIISMYPALRFLLCDGDTNTIYIISYYQSKDDFDKAGSSLHKSIKDSYTKSCFTIAVIDNDNLQIVYATIMNDGVFKTIDLKEIDEVQAQSELDIVLNHFINFDINKVSLKRKLNDTFLNAPYSASNNHSGSPSFFKAVNQSSSLTPIPETPNKIMRLSSEIEPDAYINLTSKQLNLLEDKIKKPYIQKGIEWQAKSPSEKKIEDNRQSIELIIAGRLLIISNNESERKIGFHLLKYLADNTENSHAYLYCGLCYYNNVNGTLQDDDANKKSALRYLTKSANADKTNYLALFYLGFIYIKSNLQNAITFFNSAIKAKPNHVKSYEHLAFCYWKVEEKDENKKLKNLQLAYYNYTKAISFDKKIKMPDEFLKIYNKITIFNKKNLNKPSLPQSDTKRSKLSITKK